MSNTISDIEKLEMALSMNMNPNTSAPLTESERKEFENLLATLKATEPEVTVGQVDGTEGAQSVPHAAPVLGNEPTGSPVAPGPQPQSGDLQSMIQSAVNNALGNVLGGAAAGPASFDEVLKQVDPRDSDAALAMLEWLESNGRFQVIGNIRGGGYLWHYQEPKGSSKEGYIPGATQGGRMVDQAVEQARASGAKPRKTGLCPKCYSAVEEHEDGTVSLDGQADATVCSSDNGPHLIA